MDEEKSTFLKDSVCYYVRITEDVEVENALRREVERFEQDQSEHIFIRPCHRRRP